MPTSLYFVNDAYRGLVFGRQPYNVKYWAEFGVMKTPIGLKHDLHWGEVGHLQNILRKADIWDGFPAKGYTLVNAEFKAGDENQRLDMLYIRDDGALLPCELKVGGGDKDSHGQLIRYIADLQFQATDLDWVKSERERFLASINDELARRLHRSKFDSFICESRISNRSVRILPRTGVIIDEGFPPQCLKAVRYLNGYCGFAIRLIQIDAYTNDGWTADLQDYMYRVDFTDVQ